MGFEGKGYFALHGNRIPTTLRPARPPSMPGGKQQFLARINRFTGSRPCGAGEAT